MGVQTSTGGQSPAPAGREGTGEGAGPSALESAIRQRGESPLRARALRPVTEGNCVAARRGGEQPEVNGQSAGKPNAIRPETVASLLGKGEAWTRPEAGSPSAEG